MILTEPLTYQDPEGKDWTAPTGTVVNGATIPRALWSSVGAPFVGKYRRASVVHDYFVGEGANPGVSRKERRAADKMFYHACRTDGCSPRFAAILYIGVALGTWASKAKSVFKLGFDPDDESFEESPADRLLRTKFEKMVKDLDESLDGDEINQLDRLIRENL
ncbi:MAG: DUF1353 domain-containing protein [Chromatiales bacterium]|nr:DUF1353 domain-containing protein [Chromatiales bacterium]